MSTDEHDGGEDTTEQRDGADATEQREGEDTSDQSQSEETSYRDVLAQAVEKGVLELDRPTIGIFLSGLSAGLDIGFGPLLMVAILATSAGGMSPMMLDFVLASAYSIGFVFVVVGQSALFTEHTTLAIIPVFDGRASWRDLLRVWGLIYSSNILGATVFAALGVLLAPAYGIAAGPEFGDLARPLLGHPWWVTLVAAVFAGWLMGLLAWLVSAADSTVSEFIAVWLVTLVIGFLHLPHSIAGTVEVLFGLFAAQGVTVGAFVRFLALSTAGNIVGGSVFVGLVKYAHATQAGREAGASAESPPK